jgi:hypothetical protein
MPISHAHPFRLLIAATALLIAMTLLSVGAVRAADDEVDFDDGPAAHLREIQAELKEIKAEMAEAKAEDDLEVIEELTRRAKSLKQQIPLIKKLVDLSAKLEQAESTDDDAQIESLEGEIGKIELKLEVINWSMTLEDLKQGHQELADLKQELTDDGDQNRAEAADALRKQIAPLSKKITALLGLLQANDVKKAEEAMETFEPAWEAFEQKRDLFFLDLELKEANEEGDPERIKEIQEQIKERTEDEKA